MAHEHCFVALDCINFSSFQQSSGSGSESGIRTQKYSKSKSVEASDNNTDSYDEDDNTSIGLNVRDGSDNGSGTQVLLVPKDMLRHFFVIFLYT